ncbi:MAG: caspase family protein, partial [Actinomycetota bacterium]
APGSTVSPTERPTERRMSVSVPAPVSRPATQKAVKAVKADPGVSTKVAGAADKVALLVGINNAPGSTPLEGSITDVKNMKAALLMYGFKESNIQVLTEGKASRTGILNGLSSLTARSKSNGIAVFLLATHSGSSGGDLTFATGGGGRISRHELASHLGRVKGRLFSMLPTCYSKGYALPGVIGKNRIAVFSSSADEYTWQMGGAGSWLVYYMVKQAMVNKKAPGSIEKSFAWAKKEINAELAERAPIISDGIAGDLVLGKVPSAPKPSAPKSTPKPSAPSPDPTPAPTTSTKPCGGGLLGLFGGCR